MALDGHLYTFPKWFINVDGHLVPDGAFNIGTATAKPNTIYATNITATTVTADTISGGIEVPDGSVTLAKLANLAQDRVIGRISTGSGVPEALTGSNVRSIAGLATTDAPTFAGLTLTGALSVPNGTAGAPAVAFTSDPDTGIYYDGSGGGLSFGGAQVAHWSSGAGIVASRFRTALGDQRNEFNSNGLKLGPASALSWAATVLGTEDLFLYRDAANTLAQRNSTNVQTLRIYGTFTDASNYERLSLGYSSGDGLFVIGPEAAGTGQNRILGFRTAGSLRWQIDLSGHLVAVSDNTFDFGASGATRVRTIYVGTSLLVQQGSSNGVDINHQDAGIGLGSAGELAWTSGAPTASRDLKFVRDAANIAAQRNGTNAQTFRIYNTFTDASNYERLTIQWSAGLSKWLIGPESAGTGAPRAVKIESGLGASLDVGANLTCVGQLLAATGSQSAPSISFSGQTGTGLWHTGSILEFSSAGTQTARFSAANAFFRGKVELESSGALSWSSGVSGTAGLDLALYRDAANTLAQRNGTNAQAFRLYETFTDASNYSRVQVGFNAAAANVAIQTVAAGTGSTRNIAIASNRDVIIGSGSGRAIYFYNNYNPSAGTGSQHWQISSSGHFLAGSDNTYDIGVSGGPSRPRTGYFGTSVVSPTITLAGGTVTTSSPLITGTITWNAGAVTFKALDINVTDTASAVGSLLADFRVGGTSQVSIRKDGRLTAQTLALPVDDPFALTNQTDAAGANTGALANAPSSGNPAFWLRVNINGGTYAVPCWSV